MIIIIRFVMLLNQSEKFTDGKDKTHSYIIQLLTYLNGNTLSQTRFSESELKSITYEAGKVVAIITKELQVMNKNNKKGEIYHEST